MICSCINTLLISWKGADGPKVYSHQLCCVCVWGGGVGSERFVVVFDIIQCHSSLM